MLELRASLDVIPPSGNDLRSQGLEKRDSKVPEGWTKLHILKFLLGLALLPGKRENYFFILLLHPCPGHR